MNVVVVRLAACQDNHLISKSTLENATETSYGKVLCYGNIQ